MPKNGKSTLRSPISLWLHSQKIRYLAIGAWNTLFGYSIFAGLYVAVGQHISYIYIAVLSHIVAVTQSFATQRWIVFRSSGNCWAEYVRFHIAHLGSLVIGLSTLPLMIEVFKTPPLLAQGIITILIVVASYFVHRHFTFRSQLPPHA